ncbi:IclR family transcriptional regulator domain-containing protein [Cupriavidus basilensis]
MITTERAYGLAAVVVSLADAFHHATAVPDIALPLMRKIAETEKVNVGLAVPDQTTMVYLAAVRHSRDSVSRTRRVAPGTRVPMELTSIGMAWLAAAPAGVRDHCLARIAEMPSATNGRLCTMAERRAALPRPRRKAIAPPTTSRVT